MKTIRILVVSCAAILAVANRTAAQTPPDEAKAAGKSADYFHPKPPIKNYFAGMDAVSVAESGDAPWPDQLLDKRPRPSRQLFDLLALPDATDNERLGRNTWMLWCGGNEGFWDWLANNSRGSLDLLKLLDSRKRAVRWRDAGLVNEPGMVESLEPDQFGLWLDLPSPSEGRDYRRCVIESATGGRSIDAPLYSKEGRFADIPPAHIYGLSSGVIGLRLFPNPKFDEVARRKWDSRRYYEDPSYYEDPNLIRPYRVGMSCAFCHASAHPLNPPLDPAHPRWENLSGSIGSQYLRIRAVFGNLLKPRDFTYHLLDSQPPGSIDTSLIPSDHINNTNTMNAIWAVPYRVIRSFENPREKLASTAAGIPSVWQNPDEAPETYKKLIAGLPKSNETPRYVPHILLDGADSIGAYGALARVYLNIGTYYEQWIRLHEPLTGFIPPSAATDEDVAAGRTQLPFKIKDCQAGSVYWQATQRRVEPLRDYFLKITPSMPLLDANGPEPTVPRVKAELLARGRRVFAANCIVCHSSIQPESDLQLLDSDDATTRTAERAAFDKLHHDLGAVRKREIRSWEESGELWDHDPGRWLRNDDYRRWAAQTVEIPNFWRHNFLSTDMRLPVNYIGTNSGRAMATNAMNGHMWEDFASDGFRSLPSVGSIEYFNPYTQQKQLFTGRHKTSEGSPVSGGGPGFYRPASLISVWATAPFLHNNSLGRFNNDPSVKGRLEAFDDGIRKLLYPERRLANSDYAKPQQLQHDRGLIWRTPCETYIRVPGKNVPLFLRRLPFPKALLEWSERIRGMGNWRLVPSLGLLGIVFLLLFFLRGRSRWVRRTRYFAYGLGLTALLIGFLAYLDTGGLGDLEIGPIPAGTPVNLLANIDPEVPRERLKKALSATISGLTEIESRRLEGADRDAVYRDKIVPALLDVNKCPDFVMDKGHYFPWFEQMSDDDKEALIELLKTF